MDGRSNIPYLSGDIVNSILLKLPMKSLSRFRSCCKSWHRCVDDADFIKSHLRNSSVNISGQKFFLVRFIPSLRTEPTPKYEFMSTEASINADSKVVYLNIPEFCFNYSSLQVFSCSGLVLTTSYNAGYSMTLFNPAIGKYKLIPNSLNKNRCLTTSPIFGFAYDFVAEDYKVICAHCLTNKYFNVAEVYSIKNQCWRTIHNTFPASHRFLDNDQVSLNGIIHRMSLKRAVISFHVVDEKFTVTPVPKTYGEMPTLHALGDGVCVFTTVGEENLIWSLEKDRWNCINKFPTLHSLLGLPIWSDLNSFPAGIFLFVKENGNILWRKNDCSFIEYDLRKNEYTEFKSPQVPNFGRIKTLYVESLVSLKISWD
ncbi:hypothetical protein EJD97_013761 [Solanum chilense]|uniref:F-box domain-containing protein n=1 Tax=Solanum chilense TaxID=4083 RepID=A0A6N2BD19_SOLCI|nr:hypothetical protein EJD97_013761 [Solanum chilense]